jgi:cytochrome c
MKVISVVVAVAIGAASGAVLAQSGADLLKSKGCLNCHDADKKKVGPAFKDIAAKHGGKANDALVAKLKEGKGHPKIAASDAELKTLVDTVVSTK